MDEIGSQTAVVRAAVTAVQESKPLENILLMSQIPGRFFNGGAVAEIEVFDAQGVQIAAASVACTGRDWEIVGYILKGSHAEKAMERAAKQLSRELVGSEDQVE